MSGGKKSVGEIMAVLNRPAKDGRGCNLASLPSAREIVTAAMRTHACYANPRTRLNRWSRRGECGRLQQPDRRSAQARTIEESRMVYQDGGGHPETGFRPERNGGAAEVLAAAFVRGTTAANGLCVLL